MIQLNVTKLSSWLLVVLTFNMGLSDLSAGGRYDGTIMEFSQPDGTPVQIRLYGDEFYAVGETLDGYTVTKDLATGAFCYAEIATNGKGFVSTGKAIHEHAGADLGIAKNLRLTKVNRKALADIRRQKLGLAEDGLHLPEIDAKLNPRRYGHSKYKPEVEKKILKSLGRTKSAILSDIIEFEDIPADEPVIELSGGDPADEPAPVSAPIYKAPPSTTTIGTRVGLVLLASFPDRQSDIVFTKAQVDDYFNDPDYTEFGNATSIYGYFNIQSNGKLKFNNIVTAYFTAANNRSYYVTDQGVSFGVQARWLINEGIDKLAAEGFDFSQCDGDGDGRIDGISCFYAGSRVNSWNDDYGLWPHRSSSSNGSLTAGGLTNSAYDYQITDMGLTNLTIGTVCHEVGHMLVYLPDLYAYDSNAAEVWRYCLMNTNGSVHPPHISAYLKTAAGWADIVDIDSSSSLRGALQIDNNYFYRYLNPSDDKEYFMLELRGNLGYEGPYGGAGQYYPTHGLVPYHVYEDGDNRYSSIYADGSGNYTNPYELLVLESSPPGSSPWYIAPNPGTSDGYGSGDELSNSTTPAGKWWSLTGRTEDSDMHIHTISAPSEDITFTIGTGAVSGTATIASTRPHFEVECDLGDNADARSFYLFNSQSGSFSYTISDDASWLSVSPASGSVTSEADEITLTFTTSGESAGFQTATITVTAAGTSNTPFTMSVNLNVNAAPTIDVPASISAMAISGNTVTTELSIKNSGGGLMDYSLSKNETWLSLSETTGMVQAETDLVDITLDASSLAVGTYTDNISITATGATNTPQTVPLTFNVNSSNIIVRNPNGGESWIVGMTRNISWFTNLSGTVKIELYKGGALDTTISASTANDGSYDWPVPIGQNLGTDYQIRISSLETPSQYDNSDADFSIIAQPTSITLDYSESFESGLGDWAQSATDTLDWTRDSGGTPSGGTGPTTGQDGIWYLYTEGSNSNHNKEAVLTLWVDLRGANAPDLTFWYHMYGGDMGTLSVDASTDGVNWNSLFTRTGDQTDNWYSSTSSLSSYAGQFVLVRITGATGTWWATDMAIDNITIVETVTTNTVTYDGNGNDSGSVPVDGTAYNDNDTVTVLGNTGSLARASYTFAGWNTTADGSGNTYAAGGTFQITANTTLYALWTPVGSTQNFVVENVTVNISEGGSGNIGIRLESVPSGDVNVAVSRISGDTDLTFSTGNTLTFTTGNWSAYQYIDIDAGEDNGDTTSGNALFKVTKTSGNGVYGDNLVDVSEIDDDITLTVNDSGNGSATGGGIVDLDSSPFSIVAIPDTNYNFNGWSGNIGDIATVSSNNTTISTNVDETITANFVSAIVSVLVETDPVSVSEGGSSNVRVKFSQAPLGDITLGVHRSGGDTDLSVSGSNTFVISSGNWDNWHDISFSAAEDNGDTSSDNALFLIYKVSGGDPVVSETVDVQEIDDDFVLTIGDDGNGSTTGSGTVDSDDGPFSISATPDTGYEFSGWTGNIGMIGDVSGNATDISTSIAETITANFTPIALTLTVENDPVIVAEGGSNVIRVRLSSQPIDDMTLVVSKVSGDASLALGGANTLAITSGNWNLWHSVTINASEDGGDTSNGNALFGFTKSSGTSPLSYQTCDVREADDDFTLTVNNDGSGGTTGSGIVDLDDDPYAITATPNTGYSFSHWSIVSGSGTFGSNTSASTNVSASADLTVLANFLINTYTMTYTAGIGGNVSLASESVDHGDDGSAVTATANVGYSFVNWTGDITSTDNPITLTSLTGDNSITANFALDTLTVVSSNIIVAEGSSNTFMVSLSGPPAGDVVIGLTKVSGDGNISIGGGNTLTFSSGNWNTLQPITINASQDDDAVNGVGNFILNQVSGPNSVSALALTATESDDDTLQLSVSALSVEVPEGSTNTISVSLDAAPTSDVTVTAFNVSGDSDLDVQGLNTMLFSTGSWNIPQVFTFQASEDDTDVADGTATIRLSATGGLIENVDLSMGEVDDDIVLTVLDDGNAVSTTSSGYRDLDDSPYDLTASANMGYSFSHWSITSGAGTFASNTSSSTNISSSSNITVLANFVLNNYTLTYIAGVGGDVSLASEIVSHGSDGSAVTATANTGYFFQNWTGDVTSTDNPLVLQSISGANTVTANFSPVDLDIVSSNIIVTEGSTNTFAVRLSAPPAGNIEVGMTKVSGDGNLNVTGGNTLTFTQGNWNLEQMITIEADQDADALDSSANFRLDQISGLNSVSSLELMAQEDDDEAIFLVLSQASLVVPEGSSNTFAVQLASIPPGNLIVSISSEGPDGDVSVSSNATLYFNPTNWNIDQTVILSASEDDLDVQGGSSNILLSGLGIENATLLANEEDDDLSLSLSGTNGTTVGNGIYELEDSPYPISAIPDIGYEFISWSGNVGELGDLSSNTTDLSTSVNESLTANFTLVNLVVLVESDPVSVNEGSSGNFRVRLSDAPSGNITLLVSKLGGDSDVGLSSSNTLVISSANWNDWHRVDISAAEDDGDTSNGNTLFLVSQIAGLNTVSSNTCDVEEIDDDILLSLSDDGRGSTTGSGIVDLENGPYSIVATPDDGYEFSIWSGNIGSISDLSGNSASLSTTVDESITANFSAVSIGVSIDIDPVVVNEGGAGNIRVRLDAQPAGDIDLVLTQASGDGDVILGTNSLNFTGLDWNSWKEVGVSVAHDDDVVDEMTSFVVDKVSGINPVTSANVRVDSVDDDTPGFIVNVVDSVIPENGSGNLTVVLSAQPQTDVVFTVSSSDNLEAVVSPSTLTFSSSDWNVAQLVLVDSVDDDHLRDDSVDVSVVINSLSTDDDFDLLSDNISKFTLSNDDTAGFSLSSNLITLSEDGGVDSVTVTLESEPTSDVVINIESGNTSEAVVTPSSFIFTSADWNVGQQVTISAIDDSDFGDDATEVTLSIDIGLSDNNFDGLSAQVITVSITSEDSIPEIVQGGNLFVMMDEDGAPTPFPSFSLGATEADGDIVTWSLLQAAMGSVNLISLGNTVEIDYFPLENWSGTDNFTVQVFDPYGYSDNIFIEVWVAPRNDAPVNVSLPQLSGVFMVANIVEGADGTWNDSQDTPSGNISFSYQWQRAEDVSGAGVADILGATSKDYTATLEDDGKYLRLAVTATDDGFGGGGDQSSTAYSLWTLISDVPNSIPVIDQVGPLSVFMDEDGAPSPFVAPVISATDLDGDDLSWSLFSVPSWGTATVGGVGASPGTLSYTPDSDFSGSDSFTVMVEDGKGGFSSIAINVNISAVNDTPENSVAPVISGVHEVGEILSVTTGEWNDNRDTPAGNLSLSRQWYRADDAAGTGANALTGETSSSYLLVAGDASKYVMLRETVTDDGVGSGGNQVAWVDTPWRLVNTPGNNPPVISQGGNVMVTMDKDGTPTAWMTPSIDATDLDGDALTWSVSSLANNGTATASGVGSSPASMNYAPDLDWTGVDSFVLRVEDGQGGLDEILIEIVVRETNIPPEISQSSPIVVLIDEDEDPTGFVMPTVSANDLDGDILSWSLLTQAGNGSAAASGTGNVLGSLTYTPNMNWNGTDAFVIEVSDGIDSDSIEIQVVVSPINDAPSVAGGSLSMVEFVSANVTLDQLGYSDLEDDELAYIRIDSLPSGGELSLNGGMVSIGDLVSRAEILAGNLVYSSNLRPSMMSFYVSDGLLESAVPGDLTFAVEDTIPPSLLSYSPADGDLIYSNSAFEFIYSEPMSIDALLPASYSLGGSAGTGISVVSVSGSGNGPYTLGLSADLNPGRLILELVRMDDEAGNPMDNSLEFNYEVRNPIKVVKIPTVSVGKNSFLWLETQSSNLTVTVADNSIIYLNQEEMSLEGLQEGETTITITDDLGNTETSTVRVRLPGMNSNRYSLPTYESEFSYLLMSFPYFLDGTSRREHLLSMLENKLGPMTDRTYLLWTYDNTLGTYVRLDRSTEEINIAQGFWVGSVYSNSFEISAEGPQSDEIVCIDLSPGWNLVGNPFMTAIPVANIHLPMGDTSIPVISDAQSILGHHFWYINKDLPEYLSLSQLEVGQGAWLYNGTSETQKIIFSLPDGLTKPALGKSYASGKLMSELYLEGEPLPPASPFARAASESSSSVGGGGGGGGGCLLRGRSIE